MKAALVYTSTTPELIETVEREVRSWLKDVELLSYADPSILAQVREVGYVTAPPAARLMKMYTQAIEDGAEAILNICSSVGEVADSFQDAADYLGVPLVRIDQAMCHEAVICAKRIGVMATLPTTLIPTCHTLAREARKIGRHCALTECLVDGVFGVSPDIFRARMLEEAMKIRDQVDAIVLAQGSMAYVEKDIEKATGVMTLSSPRFGARALYEALVRKGLVS